MALPLEPLVVEGAVASPADHRRRRHREFGIGPAHTQPGDDRRHVGDGALRQVAHLGARIGQDLLPRPVVELLGHLQRLRRRPAEARVRELLKRRQIMQPRRTLAPALYPHLERTREAARRLHHGLRPSALHDALLRRVAHPEPAIARVRIGHDLEVAQRHEVADLELAPARDRERRRLHPPDPDHRSRAVPERHRRGAGQRQVVDLVGLPARHRRVVEPRMLAVGPGAGERIADALRVLRGEHHPQHLAAVAGNAR